MSLHGIDISHYQAGLQLAKTDAQFALFKATEGTGYRDPECGNFVRQARNAGLPWGLYAFHNAGADVSREVDNFLDTARSLDAVGAAILVLDWEDSDAGNTGRAKTWLDQVTKATGVRPMIYMSQSVATSHDWRAVADHYRLWVARYNDTLGSTGAWANPTMWQYTDRHPTAGWKVDGNRFYGSKDLWRSIARGTTSGGEDDMDQGDEIVKWSPDEGSEGKTTVGKTLNQARGYSEDAYQRIKKVENKVDKILDLLQAQK